ncbi:hypothetical protein D9758_017924 [Tetrapyrgos nigripes]|uniref:Uncharacterized protein n=1 Tax=Tetrapyrgos nigripes TaxID=182062 RepID=A0A8H5C2E7_9AGAR|nr:hypothetical protein D9758_017924 [Tetrapyrgos nigripes]
MASIDALAKTIKEFEGGLIGQVAEELWEVANKKIRNLTKEGISIVDYKKKLAQESAAAIEKAKLFSKTAPKGKA